MKSSFSIYTAAFDVPINVTSLIEGAINSVSATGVPGAEEEMLPVIGCAGPVFSSVLAHVQKVKIRR